MAPPTCPPYGRDPGIVQQVVGGNFRVPVARWRRCSGKQVGGVGSCAANHRGEVLSGWESVRPQMAMSAASVGSVAGPGFATPDWKPARQKSAILALFMGGALCPQAMRDIVSGWIWNWCLQTVGLGSVEVDVCLGQARRLEASTPEVGDPRPFRGWSTVSAGNAEASVRLGLELVPPDGRSQQCRGRRS